MIAVPHRMIFDHELARERSIAIERHSGSAIQFVIGKSPCGSGRRSTVLCQQRERIVLCRAVIPFRVVAIHCVNGVPGHAGDRLARGKQAGQVDLDGIDACNVLHDYANLASVPGEACLPLCLGQCVRKGSVANGRGGVW
jgi:hypothetical protein